MTKRPTCVIADDHPLMREVLRMRLEVAGIDVVGEASDGALAVELITDQRPTLAILDLNMPHLDGIEVIARVGELRSQTRLIMYATSVRLQDVERALGLGASGYLDKGADSELLTSAIQVVLAGGQFVDPVVAGQMLAPQTMISTRERHVLELLADGLQNKEIAVRLSVSTETVKAHVTSLMTKLHVQNRTGAVALALRDGLIN